MFATHQFSFQYLKFKSTDTTTKNGRSIKIVDGALILKNIQKSMEGYYLCKASNGIGGISAVARIAVQGMIESLQ